MPRVPVPIELCPPRHRMTTKPDISPDQQLVQACLAGDETAWSELVDRYSRLVYSVPARHGLPRESCEDVFQSVWALVVRHLEKLRDVQTLPAWLITTTQRETWRVGRKAAREGGLSPDAGELTWSDPEEAAMLEDRQRLRAALAELDTRCRDLLLAVFAESVGSYDEVGERLGMPRGSIGPTRARCLEKLREGFDAARA